LELVTLTDPNLFSLDEHIKEHLKSNPELSTGAQLKIILYKLITYEISVQLKEIMSHMEVIGFMISLIMKLPKSNQLNL